MSRYHGGRKLIVVSTNSLSIQSWNVKGGGVVHLDVAEVAVVRDRGKAVEEKVMNAWRIRPWTESLYLNRTTTYVFTGFSTGNGNKLSNSNPGALPLLLVVA